MLDRVTSPTHSTSGIDMPKMYFSWDNDTGIFSGVGEAHMSPREPGVYLLPAYATFEVPEICEVDEIAAWSGSKWVKIKVEAIQKPRIGFWLRVKHAWRLLKNEQ